MELNIKNLAHYFDTPPPMLFDVPVGQLQSHLGGPSLVKITGKRDEPVFVSSLLHGNEHTGFLAMQKLLRRYQENGRRWPRTCYWFIGNVEAAARNQRFLPHQPDFNRIWGTVGLDLPEVYLAESLTEVMREMRLFASIDIHNNTGKNPLYACIANLDPVSRHLAGLFSGTVVYFREPRHCQSIAFSKFCPATTVECGFSGDELGVNAAADFVEAVLRLDHWPENVHGLRSTVFETVARLRLPPKSTVQFGQTLIDSDFVFREDLDSLNFTALPRGTLLGRKNSDLPLIIEPTTAEFEAHHLIEYKGQEILAGALVIPSMFTKDTAVIHQDCLGYLMLEKKIV